MRHNRYTLGPAAICLFALALATATSLPAADKVHSESGIVQGSRNPASKIRAFRGIPFAAPPVGALRWQAPQPVVPWKGVRKATSFGARCMQRPIYADMVFRDPGPSEDCLYLNVWTPANSAAAHLPVMVWNFGGGFQAGSASEARQDGENLAKKGVVVVSMNYRLGIFGFFSHPELTKESPYHASGNYGLLDETAALRWVQKNIKAFGGDPGNVTIFGESAGSMSVSAQMASPLAQGLFKQAIGESGSVLTVSEPPLPLTHSEEMGVEFAQSIGAPTLKELRAKPAAELLQASADRTANRRFWPNIDGYFFPESPSAIYAAGKQAHVPLLAGWNSDEGAYKGLLKDAPPTAANYAAKIHELYGDHADDILKLYPAGSERELKDSARDLAGDRFIAYSTWKWLDSQLAAGASPVYRYHFEQAPPAEEGKRTRGAYHSADIMYVFEALDSAKFPWSPEDRKLSDQISSYWTNFAKTGNPNGEGLPDWPTYTKEDYRVMHLNSAPAASPDTLRPRDELLERIANEKTEP